MATRVFAVILLSGWFFSTNVQAKTEMNISVVPKSFEFEKINVDINAARDYVAPANLYVPTVAPGRKLPAVLLQFGSQGDKDVEYIVAIGQGLAKRGYVVLTMDMPGRGTRKNNSPLPDGFEELIGWYMEDYATGVDFLESHPMVDATKISYAGTSLGAITGIPFCAKDTRIKVCTSIVGGGSEDSGLPEELDCAVAISKIAPRATLLINGTLDTVIPMAYSKLLHDRVKEPSGKIWYAADHYLRGIDNEEMYDRMDDFMTKHLSKK